MTNPWQCFWAGFSIGATAQTALIVVLFVICDRYYKKHR